MSARQPAAERLRNAILALGQDIVPHRALELLDATLAHERSAGAAPLDVLRRHSFPDGRLQDVETCPDDDHAADLHAILARLSEGTDR